MRCCYKQLTFWILTCCLLSLTGPRTALGNGGYLPEVSYPTPPRIPSQTALIVHDGDNNETLVVESTMRAGESSRYAWILPVPSEPEAIEKVEPGALQTLRFCLGPIIEGGTENIGLGVNLFFFFLFSLTLTVRLFNSKEDFATVLSEKLSHGSTKYLILLLLIDFMSMISVAEFPQQTAREANGELGRQRVGNYEVATVKAKSRAELDRWLTENRFAPLPEGSAKTVDDYAREGWCFLVSRLENAGGALLTPHPLRVSFKTKKPVYPMRLTAMAAGQTEVNLYVAGNGRYEHPLLETVLADHFVTAEPRNSWDYGYPAGRGGRETGAFFAQPELMRIVPEGMWITALKGTLKPDQMDRDIVLQKAKAGDVADRKVVYTAGKALRITIFNMILAFTLLAPILIGICRLHRHGRRYFLAFPILLIAAGVVSLERMPVMSNVVTSAGRQALPQYAINGPMKSLETIYQMVMAEQGLPETEQPKRLRARLAKEVTNPFDRQKMREEASPGNFTVRTDARGRIMLEVYDHYGRPRLAAPRDEERKKAAEEEKEAYKAMLERNRQEARERSGLTTGTTEIQKP